MNLQRVLLGGLLAGVLVFVSEGILNGVVLADQIQALMASNGLVEASWAIPAYAASSLLLGLIVAWLYAAMRPRLGAGWTTGAQAGVVVWLTAYVGPTIFFGAMGLALGAGATMLALGWGLVELILAGAVAGALYKEAGTATPAQESTRGAATASV
jgi:hypothetical protein